MDVDTGAAADSDDEYSPAGGGGAAAAAAAPRRSRRATEANPLGLTQGARMRFEDLPSAASAAIGAQLRLRDLAALARTGTTGREMAGVGKRDAALALFRRVRRAVPAPYIYRYEGDYDPNVPDPGWGAANAPGHHFNYVQALGFQNAEHSNPTFPQSWTPAGSQRLTPNIMYELEDKMVDRGVGGPPYQGQTTTNPYVVLPGDANAIPTALAQGNQAWTAATIPRQVAMAWAPQMRRYNIPTTRAELARSGIHGDGVVLYEERDMVDAATDPQVHPSQPALMHRYQIRT